MIGISEEGVDFIKYWEGLRTSAYLDIAGVWTIGYGHTGSAAHAGATLSEARAETLLRCDLTTREETVCRLIRVSLNQNEFDALASFEFNTGALTRSTALRKLNMGDRIGAAEALTWWNKARVEGELREVPGLTRRRAAEKDLFLTPVKHLSRFEG